MPSLVVIDDEDAIRELFRIVLTRAGYAVATAKDGAAGLAIVRSQPVDAVITDLVMPHQEGLETIGALRQEFPRLPIIAMSGALQGSQYLEMASRMGARRTLMKPFLPQTLLEAVADVLRPAPPEKGYAFVLLDDDAGQRSLHALVLRKTFPGCRIAECVSSAEALDRCRTAPVDVVLADHHLQGGDGVDFIRALKTADIPCPVVMITNSRDPNIRLAAAAAGVARVCGPDDGDFTEHLRALLAGSASPPG